LKIYKEHANY